MSRGVSAQASPARVRFDSNLYIMEADELTTPFDHPFDLRNSSILFTRVDSSSFKVQRTSLVYEDGVAPWTDFRGSEQETRTLPFAFPFYAASYTSVTVSEKKGLFFATVPVAGLYQYDLLEALSQRVPVIAPLLDADAGRGWVHEVRVKEVPGTSVTFNYFGAGLDMQVTLFSNGNIRFSYKDVPSDAWGAAMVTSGAEPFYDVKTSLLSAADPAGDSASSAPDPLRAMTDIRTIAVERVSNSALLKIRVTLDADLVLSSIPAGETLDFYLSFGASDHERAVNDVYVVLDNQDVKFLPPGGGSYRTDSPAVTIDGKTVTIHVLEDSLVGAKTGVLSAWTWYSGGNYAGDYAESPLSLGVTGSRAGTDFSSLTSEQLRQGPIVETFTIPTLSTNGVWERLQRVYGFTDDEIDQVAIYTTFHTDIRFYAGGYSTVGNAGADGTGSGGSTSSERTPALMHMSRLDDGWNDGPEGLLHLRAHEFGHRWLYFIRVRENGVDTRSLNPGGAHPKKGVHAPAAFNVVTGVDTSAMGGGYFTQTGPSTYTTASEWAHYGYSWPDLYLMGLADASEVPPWFYLNGPDLEAAYYANVGITYEVTARTEVVVQQIIDAEGPRNPSYASSQKSFKELVVILERPNAPLSPAEIADYSPRLVDAFHTHFSSITGGRGTVVAPAPPNTKRRRAIRSGEAAQTRPSP